MSGMFKSRTTTSKPLRESFSMASSPLDACVTVRADRGLRHAAIISRMTLLSSTTRISAKAQTSLQPIFMGGRGLRHPQKADELEVRLSRAFAVEISFFADSLPIEEAKCSKV